MKMLYIEDQTSDPKMIDVSGKSFQAMRTMLDGEPYNYPLLNSTFVAVVNNSYDETVRDSIRIPGIIHRIPFPMLICKLDGACLRGLAAEDFDKVMKYLKEKTDYQHNS